ncbi:MAG TPA: triose-phosphate isomerase [Candidatus Thermoplasmatota archaeon]|nr:triose-phosphate isomerase [Candidatus Thermoplasmatota archaeon]
MLATPVVVVNFKAYAQVTGPGALELARALERAARKASGSVAVAPPMLELAEVARGTSLAVLAQHADALVPGAGTGHVTVEAINASGAKGAILNHAEHKVGLEVLQATVLRLRAAGLVSLVCAGNVAASRAAAALLPDMVAVEPPELIGGEVSVTTADPGVVRGAVDAVKQIAPQVKVLCGAGVKNGKDVRRARELGADGVLLASGVVLSKDPEKALLDLLEGLR